VIRFCERQKRANCRQPTLSNYSVLSGFFIQFKRMDIASKICARSLIEFTGVTCKPLVNDKYCMIVDMSNINF
jgi:hypothetical protein